MKIVLNKDKEKVALIRQALKENQGYCPCAIIKSDDTECMCKEFREQTTPGLCHCELYEKIED